MNEFVAIKLTTIDKKDIWININKIISIRESCTIDKQYTLVDCGAEAYYKVMESVTEILDTIADLYCSEENKR